jgi:hypothetical protein
MTRVSKEFIHEGRYCAEIEVELIEDDTAWSPYLSPTEVRKLETARDALRRGRPGGSGKIRTRVRTDAGRRELTLVSRPGRDLNGSHRVSRQPRPRNHALCDNGT